MVIYELQGRLRCVTTYGHVYHGLYHDCGILLPQSGHSAYNNAYMALYYRWEPWCDIAARTCNTVSERSRQTGVAFR